MNLAVVVQAATLLADRARTVALAANRQRRFAQARVVIEQAVLAIRALGVVPEVEAIVQALEHEGLHEDRDLDPAMAKAVYFRSNSSLRGRDMEGRARKRPSAS